jgi:phosphoglycerate dehydrogenase-like enzyme
LTARARPLRCLIVGRLPEPDLELVRDRAGLEDLELVMAAAGEETPPPGRFDCIWRLFEGRSAGAAEDTLAVALSRHPEVRWVHTVSAGVDHLGEVLAPHPGIVLTNSAGVVAIPIAEFVVGCLLQHCKRYPEIWALQQARRWESLQLRELGDLEVVIMGLGAIGMELARRLRPFGCHLRGVRRHPEAGGGGLVSELFSPEQLVAACAGADALVLAAPLTQETRGIVGRAELAALKPGACLVNIARGKLIVEEELIAALQEGPLAAAFLDAFEEEPLPPSSSLWSAPGVYISPHISWSSPHFANRAAELFAAQLRRFANGEPLINRVDLASGY